MEYKHLFGPVPSRRLGVSLGIDLVNHKTCNFNCVYCECGEEIPLDSSRKEYVNIDEVLTELKDYLASGRKLDYITFSGGGEPTLNSGLGRLVKEIKNLTDIKICLITNSSTLGDKELVEELLDIDLIMPSLDAALENSFLKIDRPHKSLKLENIISSLENFSHIYKGKIWLEVFLLEGINDSKKELEEFVKVFNRIKVDKIQLNSLDRPAPCSWVEAMSMSRLEEIKEYFESFNFNVEIIKKYKNREDFSKYNENYEKLIINMLEKRPCTQDDLLNIVGISRDQLGTYLDILLKEKTIIAQIEERGIFYRKI